MGKEGSKWSRNSSTNLDKILSLLVGGWAFQTLRAFSYS